MSLRGIPTPNAPELRIFEKYWAIMKLCHAFAFMVHPNLAEHCQHQTACEKLRALPLERAILPFTLPRLNLALPTTFSASSLREQNSNQNICLAHCAPEPFAEARRIHHSISIAPTESGVQQRRGHTISLNFSRTERPAAAHCHWF